MKKMISLILILIYVSCSNKIKICNCYKGLDKSAIEIWNQDIEYVDESNDLWCAPDLLIIKVTGFIDDNPRIRAQHLRYKNHVNIIKLRTNYTPVILAHEFGHFLGHTDSYDINSIMYYLTTTNETNFNIYNEFKK